MIHPLLERQLRGLGLDAETPPDAGGLGRGAAPGHPGLRGLGPRALPHGALARDLLDRDARAVRAAARLVRVRARARAGLRRDAGRLHAGRADRAVARRRPDRGEPQLLRDDRLLARGADRDRAALPVLAAVGPRRDRARLRADPGRGLGRVGPDLPPPRRDHALGDPGRLAAARRGRPDRRLPGHGEGRDRAQARRGAPGRERRPQPAPGRRAGRPAPGGDRRRPRGRARARLRADRRGGGRPARRRVRPGRALRGRPGGPGRLVRRPPGRRAPGLPARGRRRAGARAAQRAAGTGRRLPRAGRRPGRADRASPPATAAASPRRSAWAGASGVPCWRPRPWTSRSRPAPRRAW